MAGRWEGAAPVLEKACHVVEPGTHTVTGFAPLPFPEEMGYKGHEWGGTCSFSTRYHIQSLKLPLSEKTEVESLDFLLCLRMKISILWGPVDVGNGSLLLLKRNGLSHAEAKRIYQPIPQYHIWINIHKAVPVY